MKVAIIEDCEQDLNALTLLLEDWNSTHGPMIIYESFSSGEKFLEHYTSGRYDLLFIDIFLKGMDGIETAQAVRQEDASCLIVFLTVSQDHAWDSFPLHPFDYLLKPCANDSIERILTEALRVLPEKEPCLKLAYKRQKLEVAYSDLMYLTADSHHVLVTTMQYRNIRCYVGPFSQILDRLCKDSRFLFPNRGVILNMQYIEKLEKDSCVMTDGQYFPIRRRGRAQIIDQFLAYQYAQTKTLGERFHQL